MSPARSSHKLISINLRPSVRPFSDYCWQTSYYEYSIRCGSSTAILFHCLTLSTVSITRTLCGALTTLDITDFDCSSSMYWTRKFFGWMMLQTPTKFTMCDRKHVTLIKTEFLALCVVVLSVQHGDAILSAIEAAVVVGFWWCCVFRSTFLQRRGSCYDPKKSIACILACLEWIHRLVCSLFGLPVVFAHTLTC